MKSVFNEHVKSSWAPAVLFELDDLRHTTMGLYLPIAVLSYGWAARHQYMASLRPEPELCVLLRSL